MKTSNLIRLCTISIFTFFFTFNVIAQCNPDIEPPVAGCITEVNVSLSETGVTIMIPEFIEEGSYDNCTAYEDLVFSISPATVSCEDIGTPITATLTVMDEAGNWNTCTTTVNVEDKLKPQLVCLNSINVSLPPSGEYTLAPDDLVVIAEDNCDFVYDITPATVSCEDIGIPVMVEVMVTDQSGNFETCITTVNVEDKLPPQLVCADAINISLPQSGEYTILPDDLVVFVEDNCDFVYDITPATVSCVDIGIPIMVEVTVTDQSGNTATCSTTVLVQDDLPPTVVCHDNIVVQLGTGGVLALEPNMLLEFADDNCDYILEFTPSEVTCADAGKTVLVTVDAEDVSGNTASCTVEVLVEKPRPNSVEIIGPAEIECGATGIVFNAVVNGGYGPFNYNWVIKKGANKGWVITSGQGTSSITMTAGIKKLKLKLTVTDVCGKKRRDKYKTTCVESSGMVDNNGPSLIPTSKSNQKDVTFDGGIKIYPNPARDRLILEMDQGKGLIDGIQIFDSKGVFMPVLMKQGSSDETYTLSIDNLPVGIYVVVIQFENGERYTSRFVKQ